MTSVPALTRPALATGGAGRVEGGHEGGGDIGEGLVGEAALDGGGDDAGAERLGEDEDVAGSGPGIGDDALGVDEAGDGEPVERLGVLDGVAAGQDAPGLRDLVGAAPEDLVDELEREVLERDADDVHGGDRAAAHGVDVGERVGGRDLPVEVGVVDDRREEVDGLDEGAVGVEPVDGGVVGGGGSDEEVVIRKLREVAQDLREGGLPELGGSSGAGGQGGELADLFA